MSIAQQLLIPHYGKEADVFNPLDVANLQFWLDGTDPAALFTDIGLTTPVVSDSDPVAGWLDKLGNHNPTQGTVGLQPRYRTNIINGLSIVELFATNRYLSFGGASLNLFRNIGSASVTVVFQCRGQYNQWHAPFTAYNNAGSNQRLGFMYGQVEYKLDLFCCRLDGNPWQWVEAYAIDAAPNNDWIIATARVEWTNRLLQYFHNGVKVGEKTDLQTAGNTSDTASSAINIGEQGNMYIAHILTCVPAITTADRASLEAWLASQLSLTGPQVFCDGDSLTLGLQSTAGHDYPSVLLTLLGASTWRKTNGGNSNDETTNLLTTAPQTADPISSILRQKNVYVLWIGTNDLVNGARSPADTYTNITTLIQGRQAVGYQVIVCTVTPRAYTGDPADINTTIGTLNGLINANTAGADMVVDLAGDARLSNQNNGTYFYTDKLHLIDAGYAVVAELVKPAIDSLPDLN